MSKAIKIEITDEPSSDVVHRFRNLVEAIYRELRDTCDMSLDEIDHSTSSIAVTKIQTRNLGEVTQTIRRELRKHNFEQTATLSRL